MKLMFLRRYTLMLVLILATALVRPKWQEPFRSRKKNLPRPTR